MRDVEGLADIVIQKVKPTEALRREHLVIELERVYAMGWRDGALYAGLLTVGLLALAVLLFVSNTMF